MNIFVAHHRGCFCFGVLLFNFYLFLSTNRKRQDGMEIVGEVAIDGSRQRGHEAKEQLQGTEVKLNSKPSLIQLKLPPRRQSLHGFVGFGQEPPFPLNVHVLLQLFGDIAGVSYQDTVEIGIQRPEQVAVIDGWRGNAEVQESAVVISYISQFKPIKPALATMSEVRETSHGLMLVRILFEAHRQVSGIGVLHGVGLLLVQAHDSKQETERDDARFVHGHHQSFVGTLEPLTEVMPDGLLGGASGGVVVQS